MSIRKTVLSAAVLASLVVVNVSFAATAMNNTAAPAATAPAAKPMMDINTMRATKMAQHMKKDMNLSDDEMNKVKGVFKDMFDKMDKFRADMDKETMDNMKGALTTEHYDKWTQMHADREKERMEKRTKKQDKMMKKMQEDNMM